MSEWRRWKQRSKRLAEDYERACSRPVSVAVFGALPNGEDCTASIQATLDFVAKFGGGTLGFSPGEYGISRILRMGNSEEQP